MGRMHAPEEAREHALVLRQDGLNEEQIAANLKISFLLPPQQAAIIASVVCGADPHAQLPPMSYRGWLDQIRNFRGGGRGWLVVLLTLVATAMCGWFGLVLFPAGEYPKIILAIPGLAGGAAAFFATSAILWRSHPAAVSARS